MTATSTNIVSSLLQVRSDEVVIYFGEPCGKSRIGVDKIDLIRFRERSEQELLTSLRAYPCSPWELRIILTRNVFLSHIRSNDLLRRTFCAQQLLDYVVYVVVKIFLERGRKFLSHFRSNDLLRRTIAPQVVSIVVK